MTISTLRTMYNALVAKVNRVNGDTTSFSSTGREQLEDFDTLINHRDGRVRQICAWHGRDKDLDILVNDPNMYVRVAVAEHERD